MTTFAMVWRRDDPKQSAIEAIKAGAEYYRGKHGKMPNYLNTPPGFLTDQELAHLRTRWTVETTAPAYFKHDIWLGVKPQASEKGQIQ